jgi:type III pantothenate kinase
MLLAVDIGNTTVSWAVMKGKRIVQVRLIENSVLRSALKKELMRAQRKFPQLKEVILCSVVPKNLKIVDRAVRRHLKIRPLVIGKDIKVPIKNKYRNPRQVGQDRLVGAYAVKVFYGYPAVVIDLGTAITFDVISKRGEYEGGMIVPGIRLSAESLFQKTALLPRVNTFKIPNALIGKDTKESILSGIFYGYGAMCRGLIDQLARHIKGRPKVIVTGGHARLMKRFVLPKITKVDEYLIFKGMQLSASLG